MSRGPLAPDPRTLIDILHATAAAYPEASAIDDGSGALSYAELLEAVEAEAERLRAAGVRPGDRVGIRVDSGSKALYIAILAIMRARAAYVPVDADDTDERARLVFGEARVAGIIGNTGYLPREQGRDQDSAGTGDTALETDSSTPTLDDAAWIIFTSGSTGVPKGVAVSHRSAAAFVDAEANWYLQDDPLGPGDRVLAGLSVAFDASCEEMWLAWRYGACLVPAPRALVRSGEDLAQWLVRQSITVVSTVPTLAAMWPRDTIENVRLLIFGGEACPPELVAGLVEPGREVWNTYGPTEATVVSCGCRLDGVSPVSIGVPLDGWDLAVVDAEGRRVAPGEAGELIIGGVGLARYLDPAKDAEKYAPMPSLGWERAYRSGDLVRYEETGLMFLGRADDQVKVGGRRIELGEIENALQELPGVTAAAAAVRASDAGVPVLVGYLVVEGAADGDGAASFDRGLAREHLASRLAAGVMPLIAIVDDLPVRTSGKVDRAALPWPLPGVAAGEGGLADADGLSDTARWLVEQWQRVLGVPVPSTTSDFFDLGGGSLAAAQLVSRIRARVPEFTVADIYDVPRLGAMAKAIAATELQADPGSYHQPAPTPKRTQWAQTLAGVPLFIVSGVRWLVYLLTAGTILRAADPVAFAVLPTAPWWLLGIGILAVATPFGRMGIAAIVARILLAGLKPGDYPRGGVTHMRLWLAEQFSAQIDAVGLAGAPWVTVYARLLGARIGRDVSLHTLPPITGMLEVGDRSAIEPEVDLAGYWIDGDLLRVGPVRIGTDVTVGARSTLAPGTRIDDGAEVSPGSAVFGRVKSGQRWAGSPAVRVGSARGDGGSGAEAWPKGTPHPAPSWRIAYGLSSLGLALLPFAAFALGGVIVSLGIAGAPTLGAALLGALAWLVPAVLAVGLAYALAVILLVRLLAIGMEAGTYPLHSRVSWQVWTTERLLDTSRTFLFPLYSSLVTPTWLRLLGARVGPNVEASTVLLLPKMTRIDEGAFLADDTMVASYELHRGWLRIGPVRIGKRAFLGNSGMAGQGHRVPKYSLVAVLSAAPAKAKAGSSWLGSPPARLRRTAQDGEDDRTYRPGGALRLARALWELGRIGPVIVTCALGLLVVFAFAWLLAVVGPVWTLLLSGIVMLAAGALAAIISTIAKWAIVGPIRVGEHPLWSSFVWRTEVSDTFTEMLAAPWFARAAAGTPAIAVWLRSLGATIGRGVWCDSYWLPEPDLVSLGDGATVNRGCVVQTHLFHDRIMSLDRVELEPGATLGPHSVILPAATIGAHATVGPASLVMRGESVPVGSRWSGNPVGPWRAVKVRAYQSTD
ncbi:amino acid adenylation domain-containing protein [Leucobacter rhizosphaerae]|uniref:Amino acid adenylation domain-containing protein n=1 Tax=Leucobacter rhizosphaerae TaxID=2932245 RepID=A0ABY4G057_9MICO|nr:Pls/PosA family non-ribosomal peptide synthetase [Leucobacter rhizosphaerae]UOQ61861.1 amino acid adenylation domain-containing protein [Leucobacter rhizosphaerae]